MVLSLYMGSRYRSGLHYLLGSSFIIVVSQYYILRFSLFVLTIAVGLHFLVGHSIFCVFSVCFFSNLMENSFLCGMLVNVFVLDL